MGSRGWAGRNGPCDWGRAMGDGSRGVGWRRRGSGRDAGFGPRVKALEEQVKYLTEIVNEHEEKMCWIPCVKGAGSGSCMGDPGDEARETGNS